MNAYELTNENLIYNLLTESKNESSLGKIDLGRIKKDILFKGKTNRTPFKDTNIYVFRDKNKITVSIQGFNVLGIFAASYNYTLQEFLNIPTGTFENQCMDILNFNKKHYVFL